MSEPGLGVLWIDRELRHHLAGAVDDYLTKLRRNGHTYPAPLMAFADALAALGAAQSGQVRPDVRNELAYRDGQLMNSKQAAAELGVSERTVRRLVAAGEIPSLRIGRRRLFVPSELRQRIAQEVA